MNRLPDSVRDLQPGVGGVEEAVLRVVNLSKSYQGNQALDRVSFEVARGTIHALLGGNGSGKSTTVKILAGVVSADEGVLVIDGQEQDARTHTPASARELGLHFVHQQDSTFATLTVAENLAIGRGFESGPSGRIHWRETYRRAADVLERFEIDADPRAELGSLRAATQMMVAIARALQDQEGRADGVLVLDEPTASLPKREVEVLLDALRRYAAAGQSILYISHRLEEVVRIADRATVLRNGRLAANLSAADFDYQSLVVAILGSELAKQESHGSFRRDPGSETVLCVQQPEGLGLKLKAGEVVGIAGLLGSGRSRVLRQMFGVLPRDGTAVIVGGREIPPEDPMAAMAAGIIYVPEDRIRDAAFTDLDVTANLSIATLREEAKLGVINGLRERRTARDVVREFGIKSSSERALLSQLSGGNQQKVIVARWLQRKPRVLLFDEPTQGVDVGARAEIHRLIRKATDAGAVALVVSSDFDELAATCDRAVIVEDGTVVAELPGDELTEHALTTLAYAHQDHANAGGEKMSVDAEGSLDG